jgi:NAD-dependent DNA ligase
LGSLLQQVNDIFDVWKDLQSGISTFVTTANDIYTLKADFELQMKKVQQLLSNLSYKTKHKRACFFQFMILIGMGIVALNQYIALQNKNNGIFEAANFTRKQLVCDMQKKSNLLKLMKVCLSYNFNF